MYMAYTLMYTQNDHFIGRLSLKYIPFSKQGIFSESRERRRRRKKTLLDSYSFRMAYLNTQKPSHVQNNFTS